MKNFILVVLLLLLAAATQKVAAQDGGNAKGQQVHKIEIVNSNTLEVNEFYGPDVKVLRGDVQFYHDSASMFCDSAFYNSAQNTFRAFGNVHAYRLMEQSDTVHLWGDSLDYDGKTRLARMRDNVVMTTDSMRLVTENVDYDMDKNVANYFDGGVTYSGNDTLESKLGYFYPKRNELVYNKDVVLHNKDYKMYSDTLTYNVKSHVSTFQGPTEVISDENYLYSERGWYNHDREECQLTKNSYLVSKEHRLSGDTIYYYRKESYGMGRSNVEIIDTAQNITLSANEARYYEIPEHSFLTDKALMTYRTKKDTLYLHADTIFMCTDTIFTATDTTEFRRVRAYRHVKTYRYDIQTMCDSLEYNFNDSIISMYYTPVIWNKDNQITANLVKLYTIDDGVDMVELIGEAFVSQKVDSIPRYNQICGKDMVAYLDSNKITQVEVLRNAQSIYYTTEDSIVTGMNTVSAENMDIFFENSKIKRIWFYKNPKGALYPLEGLTKRQSFLNGFVWYGQHRPIVPDDIFKWGEVSEAKITTESLQAEEEEKKKKDEEEAELE